MCLILIAYHEHPELPLVVAGNRDERFARPTAPAQWWSEAPVLAGRDELSGGAWFGVSADGRIAVVTNVREGFPQPDLSMPSRGALVTQFLTGSVSPGDFVESIDGGSYAGFNLVVGDAKQLWWTSNRAEAPRQLSAGYYSVANGLINSGWPKELRTLPKFADAVLHDDPSVAAAQASNRYLEVLADRRLAIGEVLPDTGIGPKFELAVSAPFVWTPDFGSRASTVARFTADGTVTFVERRFDASGLVGEADFTFRAAQQ